MATLKSLINRIRGWLPKDPTNCTPTTPTTILLLSQHSILKHRTKGWLAIDLKKNLNRIRGWLPKETSIPSTQKNPTFENRLKQHFKIQELPNAAIIIITVGIFLSFGLISNLFDGYSLLYNLFQGIFMSLFTGGVLYGVMIIIRRRKRHT